MKKRISRVLAMILSLIMMISLCACQNEKEEESKQPSQSSSAEKSSQAEASSSEEEEEIVTLTFYTDFSPANDISSAPWLSEYLVEELGIELEVKLKAADSLMPSFLASGELPDLVLFNSADHIQAAVDGGMLVNMDEYKDQLPSIYENSVYDITREYTKDFYGGLYTMGVTIGKNTGVPMDTQVRWDLYADLDYPEVKDFDDLLDVLKQMKDLEPQNAEGLTTYGFGLWNDWDGTYMRNVAYFYTPMVGYDMDYFGGLAEIVADGSEDPRSILDDDSVYKEGLEFFFKANQMGLIDPDSVSQNYDTFGTKANAGQYLMWPVKWWSYGDTSVEDFKGMASLWPEDLAVETNADNLLSVGKGFGISSKCKNVDKAIKFINWYYSEEAVRLLQRGPQGYLWDMEGDKPVYTDAYLKAYAEGTNGDLLKDYSNAIGVFGPLAMTNQEIDPLTNTGFAINSLDRVILKETKESVKPDYLSKDWREHNGDYTGMYYKYVEENLPMTQKCLELTLVGPASDDINTMMGQIGQIVVENSWKMVFAKDEAEFEKLWDDMQKDAEALGMDEVMKDVQARWEAAKAMVGSLDLDK